MKKINRNNEKRQRVRVLVTGELGTVLAPPRRTR